MKYIVKDVIHDPILLAIKLEKATIEVLQMAEDLLETLVANAAGCVGNDGTYMAMFNPKIIKKSDTYETAEGCLYLLDGPWSSQM